ncbi:DUF2079 domain-containing protein [Patescibacteria group bacterium]|nr:DUF2079 domain-containing protein [Patescibacteria group bacterium]
MSKIINFVKNNINLFVVIFFCVLFLVVTVRINHFRYYNFDYGKFDLGNMTQMVWNVLQGNGLYLTDYFGTNLPRWSMSHVDPILYLFVPIFALFPNPMTLVYSQLVLVIFSAVLLYKIAELTLKSKFAAMLVGLSYLFYPAIGYLTAHTGFHGVTAVIPFFFAAFYIMEKMYVEQRFTRFRLVLFWLMLILTMMGKEQLPLYIFLYAVFIFLFRNSPFGDFKSKLTSQVSKLSYAVMFVSLTWFVAAFFIIIPAYAHQRVEGYQKFVESLGINTDTARDVALPNFFLSRYDGFGESYSEVIKNMILQPKKLVDVFFGGDKPDNLNKTFKPLLFLPLAYPAIFVLAIPDLAINYLTTAGGIGTAEISNHRVSMIVPVLFISTVFAIRYLSMNIKRNPSDKFISILSVFFAVVILGFNVGTSFEFNNPVVLWATQAVEKKLIQPVFAKTDTGVLKEDLKVGDVIRLSELEDKDRECALKIVNSIPDGVSVSGPDSLGAHLGMRETYAIFPALYNEADYVIVDVFSRKILTILDIDVELGREVIERILRDPNYKLEVGCGNYFVFKRVGPHNKNVLMPLQERFEYKGSVNYPFFQGVDIVDFSFPKELKRHEVSSIKVVYSRVRNGNEKDSSLEEYKSFTTLVNKKSGELYQTANLPAFAIKALEEWEEGMFYLEDIELVAPDFIEEGDYMVFIGIGNKVRTRSMYLGDIKVSD